jgi:hypothetical protein
MKSWPFKLRRRRVKRRLRREIVDVGRLHGAHLEAVRGVVSDLTTRTFEGERAPALIDLMFAGGDGIERRIALYRNVEGEIVGYVTSLRQDVRHDGRTVTIFRAVAALRPEYRHFNSTGTFGFHEAARLRLRHPWRGAYFLAPILHPSSYSALVRFWTRLYPSPRRPKDPALDRLVVALADQVDQFGEADGPLLRDRRISVRDAPALDTPYARFFAEVNPRYADGYALLILVPLTIPDMLTFAVRRTLRRRRRRAPHTST